MSAYSERGTTQAGMLDLLVQAGWEHIPGRDLPRDRSKVLIEDDVRASLRALNPDLAKRDDRVEAALVVMRQAILTAEDDGLMAANERFTKLLRGLETVLLPDTNQDVPIRVIDFAHPERNRLIVSDEVTYRDVRFDLVLWVNGIPLVVGEAKSATSARVSWANAANEITTGYEERHPAFFVPNLFSFAVDGKELRYAGVASPIQHWQKWGDTTVDARLEGWPRIELTVAQLLSPATVLNLVEQYAMYERTTDDGTVRTAKLLPRYPQYEAAEAVVARIADGSRRRGLIYHTQGSGKTLAMTWIAARLVLDERFKRPAVIAVADRTQLVTQTYQQFVRAGTPDPIQAASARELHRSLADGYRGIIATTVHKFKDAGLLSDRDDVIVLIDEAHRTQEGTLGQQMRASLPNAYWFGFTGTPVASDTHNTFELFGDPDDPGRVLNAYDTDRSIADGTTVPILIQPRPVKFSLDKDELDKAFNDLAAEEGLDDEAKERLANRHTRTSEFFHNPERIRTVVRDMLDHYTGHIAPNGMKAQIVVADQELCVRYYEALTEEIAARKLDWEAEVVISGAGKDELAAFKRSPAEEDAVLNRFRAHSDPLRFLIVTSKLGTGFDAKIEGVLYLDKVMKLHTLFQTITRTNRPWRNPETGFVKRHGIVVDYVGLGNGFARAMAPANPDAKRGEIEDGPLLEELETEIQRMLGRFVGIARDGSMDSLQSALQRVPEEGGHRDAFTAEMMLANGLWETLAPDIRLEPLRADYTWLAAIYHALPSGRDQDELVWGRLGAKTRSLIHSFMGDIRVTPTAPAVLPDAATIERLVAEGLLPEPPAEYKDRSAAEIVESLAERIKRRLEGGGEHVAVYRSIGERLDALRQQEITRAEDSVEWLTTAFQVARDLTVAEEAEADVTIGDPRIGMLTRIFEEHRPEGETELIEQVVRQIDEIVRQTAFDGWENRDDAHKDLRKALRAVFLRYRLKPSGEPWESAWEYIVKNY